MMALIHSLKYTVLFPLVVPLLSLAVNCCHSLSLVVTLCHSLYHLLSFVVIRCHSLYHSLYHSLSLDVPLVCLFINDLYVMSIFIIKKIILTQKIIFQLFNYLNGVTKNSLRKKVPREGSGVVLWLGQGQGQVQGLGFFFRGEFFLEILKYNFTIQKISNFRYQPIMTQEDLAGYRYLAYSLYTFFV